MKLFRKIFLTVTVFSASLALYAGGPIQQKVLSAISSEKALAGATISVCATSADGQMLACVSENVSMVPASNMKLVSTGLALSGLGAGFRFVTSIGYSGSVHDGVLDGDVYIIGGADPLLGAKGTAPALFDQWKKMIAGAGIKRIEGRIIGDGRLIDGPREEQSWLWEDIGTYYGTGMSGLGFDENVLRFHVEPGAEPGNNLKIVQKHPLSPWLKVDYDCRTGEKGSGDKLYLFTTDMSTEAVLRGTFAAGKPAKDVLCSNKYPELTCASEFASFLTEGGIPNCGAGYVTGQKARIWTPEEDFSDFEPSADIILIGDTRSASLKEIVTKTNHESDNFCAETLFRFLGKERLGNSDYDSSRAATEKGLVSLGLGSDCRRFVKIVDGSGLSRKNMLTARFLCAFLSAMSDTDAFEDFYSSIPVLESSKSIPAEVSSRVRRKTGSMEGVYCISGYYKKPDGEVIVFSILINNSPLNTYATRLAAERILSAVIL